MGYFKRRRQRLVSEVVAAVLKALPSQQPSGLDAIGEFYSKTLGGMGQFMNGAGELALRSAASILGQKGGIARQKNRAARKAAAIAAATKPRCALCVDPMHRGVTIPMILEHQKHANTPAEPVSEQNSESTGGDLRAIGYTNPEERERGQ